MKSKIMITCITLISAGYLGKTKEAVKLIEIKSSEYGDAEGLMNIIELERKDNISKLKLTHRKMGSSVGLSLFIMRGFYEVAKSRGTEYFTVLKEWDDVDGGTIYIGGFTNNRNADIKMMFGEEYSTAKELGNIKFMSISQCKMIMNSELNK